MGIAVSAVVHGTDADGRPGTYGKETGRLRPQRQAGRKAEKDEEDDRTNRYFMAL